MDERPTHIVLMGDFLTLNCLSSWDMNKRLKMEGRRYVKEIEAGNLALDYLLEDMGTFNTERRRDKKKLYAPELIFVEGNHEDRLTRYIENEASLQGVMDIEKDLCLKERGFEWVPYRTYRYINGIGFTHIPFNKVNPISGIDITRKAQGVTIKSCVFGHTHEFHVSNRHVEGMEHLQQTLNCGCFFEHNEDYVHGRVTNYWKGLMILDSYKPERFDITTYSMGKLYRMYSDD